MASRDGKLVSMTSVPPELASPEEDQPSWRDRIAGLWGASQALLLTRLAIFREELSEKAVFAAKGIVAVAIAGVVGAGALLLLAALIAAAFAALFHNAVLGILAAFVLYGVLAAAAAVIGWKALTRVRPFDFRATREELARDLRAVRAATAPEPPEAAADARAVPTEEDVAGIEERFRAGAE
jgi:uncharacterized membrane protein YqjE